MSFLQEYLKDLAELVNFDCGTANTAGVTHAAEIMKRHFDSIGFTSELIDLGPTAGRALLARNKPQADHYDVLFNAHLDTVFPDGTAAARPFSVEGDMAHGPGCGDCKAGCLSIFYALKLSAPEVLNRLSIAVCMNPDEETSSKASHAWLAEEGKKARMALVCEGARPDGELVRSRKGRAVFVADFHGRSAHSGNNPEDGRNAVAAIVKFVDAAYQLNDAKTGVTVNPGILRGGTMLNSIPDEAHVEFDTRFWFDEDCAKLKTALEALAAKSWGEDITVDFKQTSFKPAMPLSDATKTLVATIEKAAEMTGFTARWVDAGGASDGNNIAKAGIPVVDGCGPAGGAYHSEREFLRLDTVEERTLLLKNFLTLI